MKTQELSALFCIPYAFCTQSRQSYNHWFDLHPSGGNPRPDFAVPFRQNKRPRMDGKDDSDSSSTAGEGLVELEVLGISGECMLTLNVADSMLGRELWKMILDEIPSKQGLQLVVSHTSRLVLNKSLQQQLRGPGSTGTGVGYLHSRQFACCLAFCPRRQCWGRRVLIDWDYRNDMA